ncbi:MAG: hypothetical protein M3297_07105 [Thermoproteota archaeon]|nr:hypothetical protein [Thermoproteota archaeon]
MSTSYDKAKHIVEVDERILAVFIVDSTGKISDLFIAEDANIDRSFTETIITTLNIRFENKNKSTKDQPLGQHLWDILEYDKVRIIKIYESERLIVVLAKSHLSPGDIAQTVLGYLYESEDEQPKSLF